MNTQAHTDQIAAWRGAHGDRYVARNSATPERVRQRLKAWVRMLNATAGAPPESMLEVGCNIGLNLRALRMLGDYDLAAVEPNASARETVVADGVLAPDRIWDANALDLGVPDGAFDLVFTSGVLIHVAPEDLAQAYSEIYRASSQYILCWEYFAREPETVSYHGREDLLFKRDFGSYWLELYPDLEPLDCGFFWKQLTGLDDVTFWLFRKPDAA